ncbi:GMC family oxidoreductase [Planobispora rosea]|uniref:GMC family oxidoreductase n=1 Tax=Planobispora rosea TaxID=35762 RepID=UPI00083B8A8F|nr:GMC family oxidoreductase N-terminal domain-containing protein [Planobispora rosea]
MSEFDYIIVGSGAAGGTLAYRLTENPDVRVLLLEAGDSTIPPEVDEPAAWFRLLGGSADWGYRSVPQRGLGGRVTHEPRGRGPGGSSNLYIMMHVRGHPSDYDNWAYQGAAGWSYADVLPYFDRIESLQDAAGPAAGPQRITDAGLHRPNPASRAFIDACVELGYPELKDFNSGEMSGAGWHQLDVADGRRQGVLASYIEPALRRPNLTLRTGAQATRLLFDGDTCVGVEYLQRERPAGLPGRDVGEAGEPGLHRVHAAAEVIVACGAIESPKLLMLSGLGDPAQLRPFGIQVRRALPGVGANFHNHVLTGLMTETRAELPPPAQNLSESALFTASAPGLPAPDLQLAFVHVPFDIIVGRDHPNTVSVLPGVVRPASRGWIRLASPDPTAKPLINPNYLGDRSDLDRLVQGVRLAREIMGTRAFSPWNKGELRPGAAVTSDTDLAGFVRNTADSYHHQAGSCRMGVDDLSVVDPELRVHGIGGLRVVDASVMPAVPSGNCHTGIVMIAERAADLIKGAQHG